MIAHPAEKPLKGAVHRRRPDGVIEFWSNAQGFWVVPDGNICSRCMSNPLYPKVTYAATWAEPVEVSE